MGARAPSRINAWVGRPSSRKRSTRREPTKPGGARHETGSLSDVVMRPSRRRSSARSPRGR
jgi:hypothetical protein